MLNTDPITATEKQRSQLSLFGSWTIDALVLGGTLGLAFLGVAITYANKDLSYPYWLATVRCSLPSALLLSGRVAGAPRSNGVQC